MRRGSSERPSRFGSVRYDRSVARRRSVLIGVGVLLIGCSGGTDGADEPRPAGSDGETQSALSSAGVVSATNRIGEQYGPAVGFAVTVGALDRGYSVSQIVDASSLSDDGSIDGVAPAGPVLGVLSAPVEPAGFRRPAVAADDPPLSDFRVTVLNTTIEGIYDKAFHNPDPQIAFDEATAAARVDLSTVTSTSSLGSCSWSAADTHSNRPCRGTSSARSISMVSVVSV